VFADAEQHPAHLTVGYFQPRGCCDLRQMLLLYLVQHFQIGPVLVGSRQFAPFPWGPRPPMKADISTLLKPDILILRRHRLIGTDLSELDTRSSKCYFSSTC
jgi:hypothetical protein